MGRKECQPGGEFLGLSLDRDAEIPRRPLHEVVPVRESTRLRRLQFVRHVRCLRARRSGSFASAISFLHRAVFSPPMTFKGCTDGFRPFSARGTPPEGRPRTCPACFQSPRFSLRRARRASGRPCLGDEPEPLVEAGKRSRQPSVVKRKCLTAWAAPGILFSSNDEVCAVIR